MGEYKGTLIRLFLVQDEPDSLRTIEISNMTIKATLFPRPLYKEFLQREESKKPGVYILYGSAILSDKKPKLYIGEGDPVFPRLREHAAKKDFWTEALVFTSKDEHLTKTQIKFLESRIIGLVTKAKRVTLDNNNSSSEPTISESERSEALRFLDAIQLLTQIAGHTFFNALSLESRKPESNEIIYQFNVKDLSAHMAIRNGKYVVLAGSTANKDHLPSASESIKKLRESLMQDGALIQKDNKLHVTKDIPLNSPSYAAAIITGGNTAGPIKWKHKGKTLKQMERES